MGIVHIIEVSGVGHSPVAFEPRCSAVQYRECGCPVQRGYFTVLWDSGAGLFLCKQHLNLPVRSVQVCGASVPSCQLPSQRTLSCGGLCHKTQLCGMHRASCNIRPQS